MQKENIKYIISYIFILIFFFLGTLFYRQPFLVIMMILLIVLPIISIAILKFNLSNIRIEISSKMESVSADNNIIIDVDVINKGFFPFLNAKLLFNYHNLFYKENAAQTVIISAEAKKTITYSIPFMTHFPGLAVFAFDHAIIHDYLHLYSVILPLNREINIPVFPKEITLPSYPIIPSYFEDGDDEDLPSVMFGQQSSDIREIREYQPGDSIRSVHWKMTARTGELMVKEYDHVADHRLYVVTELEKSKLSESLEALMAYGTYLTQNREPFILAIFSAAAMDFTLYPVENADDLLDAITRLYFSGTYPATGLAKDTFSATYGQNRSFIYIYGHEVNLV